MATVETQHEHGQVTTDGGVTLHFQSWIPDQPKAVLYFVHGMAEHGGRYGFPVDHFTAHGYACWTLDLRGHGTSGGRRGHIMCFDDYDVDVEAVLGQIRQRHDGLPIFLVGHSMGGLIALRFFLDHQEVLSGAVLSSPALRAHPTQEPLAALKGLATVISRIIPGMLFKSTLDVQGISRNQAVVDAYLADPLVLNKVSARWFTSIQQAMAEITSRFGEVHQPLLIMHSGGDRLTDPKASQRWAEQAPGRWVTHVEWPELYHEMFNEPERATVFERMEAWLEERLGEASR